MAFAHTKPTTYSSSSTFLILLKIIHARETLQSLSHSILAARGKSSMPAIEVIQKGHSANYQIHSKEPGTPFIQTSFREAIQKIHKNPS